MSAQILSSAMLKWVTVRDHRVMERINRWTPPRWLRLWVIAATRGGDGWLWYGIGLIVAIFGGPLRFYALLAAFLAAAVGIAVFLRLKHVFRRRRPQAFAPHAWAKLLPPDQFSFPSGHTITAFAVATSLIAFYPQMMPELLFCAISVGISRVLLGMHFLSDVLVGAAIGWGLGSAAVWCIV